jgi:TPR repeat protein
VKTARLLAFVLAGLVAVVLAGIYWPLGIKPSGINPAKIFDLDAAAYAATQRAATSGDADANFRLGQYWMFIGRPACSKPWFQQAHRLGDSRADSWLQQLKSVEESDLSACRFPS